MRASIIHNCKYGEVPKRLKGLASNTSRRVIPVRGFKSLSLRQMSLAFARLFSLREGSSPRCNISAIMKTDTPKCTFKVTSEVPEWSSGVISF